MNMMLLDESVRSSEPARTRMAVLLLRDGCNLLSVAGFSDVLRAARPRMPLFDLRFVSESGSPVVSSLGATIDVEGAWDASEGPDVLAVFGPEDLWTRPAPAVPHGLRLASRNGTMVCGIGTGIAELAEAGLLTGRRFALPRAGRGPFQALWPALMPSTDGFCLDGRTATCPDGTLVIDLALQVVEDLLGQAALRQTMERLCLFTRRSGSLPQPASLKVDGDHQVMRHAVKFLAENFATLDGVDTLARNVSVSRRHLERLFQAHLGVTPTQHVMNLKVEHAHRLLVQTDLTVQQVADRSGFANTVHLTKWFRRAFGMTPNKYSIYG